MSKSPSFQFYASDFYMDTISWSEDMVGLHIRLMCRQWINGFIEFDGNYPEGLTEKSREIFDKIRHKYLQEKNGKFYNKRLRKVQKEKQQYVKNARKAGQDGASKRWGTPPKKNRVPHENPNRVSIALHSSSSSSDKEREREEHTFEIHKNAFTAGNDHLEIPLPETEIIKTIEYIQIRTHKKLSSADVSKNWTAFKIQNFSGKKFYQSWQECFKHFRDWLKCELNNGFENKKNSVAATGNYALQSADDVIKKMSK